MAERAQDRAVSAEGEAEVRSRRRLVDDRQARDLTGHTGESSYGKLRWELVNMWPLSGSWTEHMAVLAARQPFRDLECVRIGVDGTARYLSMSGAPIFDAQGRFKGYHGIGRNITERKRIEEESVSYTHLTLPTNREV